MGFAVAHCKILLQSVLKVDYSAGMEETSIFCCLGLCSGANVLAQFVVGHISLSCAHSLWVISLHLWELNPGNKPTPFFRYSVSCIVVG